MEEVPSGRYEILEPIGSGGMAELYLARTRGPSGFAKLVVIKRILSHLARDAAFVQMFLNEARIAATLDHPNVVTVHDFGKDDSDYFLTMEYVHGADLGTLLQSSADAEDLPLEVALHIVQGACAGLHHAHERVGPDNRPLELVHRDVSPSNVLISFDGQVKVTDFGIATATALTRTTRAGTLKGKVSYMSPEQCKGERIDRRADVFALGILLYETTLLTRLFVADNDYALMTQVLDARIPLPRSIDPEYPPALEAIVMRALARDPAQRFESAEALQAALEAFALTHGIVPSPLATARWIERRIGHRPYPSFPHAPQTDTAVEVPAPVGRRLLLAGAALLVVGTAAGLTARAAMHEPAVESDPVPVPAVTQLPIPTPPVAKTAEPTPAAAQAVDVADAVVGSDSVETAPSPAAPRRRHRKRRPRAEAEQPPRHDLDAAAPPK